MRIGSVSGPPCGASRHASRGASGRRRAAGRIARQPAPSPRQRRAACRAASASAIERGITKTHRANARPAGAWASGVAPAGEPGRRGESTPESADRPARAAPPAEPDERRAGRRSDAGRPDRRRPPPSVPAGRPDWPSRPAISINRRNDSWKPTFSTPCARRAAKARRTAACTASRRSRSPQPRCARFATATVSTRAPSTTSCSAASSPSASKARASAASRCLRPATRKPRPACRSTASAHRASRRATWPPRR